jgi:hypothetical protein
LFTAHGIGTLFTSTLHYFRLVQVRPEEKLPRSIPPRSIPLVAREGREIIYATHRSTERRDTMWRPTVRCPVCNTVMPWTTFRARKPWVCPGCLRQFQPSKTQATARSFCAIGLALAASYGLGMRGIWLLLTSAALWFPVFLICILVADRIAPLRLEPYKRYKRRESDSKDPFDSSAVDLFHNRPK